MLKRVVMSTAEDVLVEIRRADFFAIANAAWGLLFVSLAGATFVDDGSFGIPVVLNAAAGLLGLGIASYYHLRPDSIDDGTDPAPRTWFEVASLLIALGVLVIVVEFVLFAAFPDAGILS
jgi:hypothetical protein